MENKFVRQADRDNVPQKLSIRQLFHSRFSASSCRTFTPHSFSKFLFEKIFTSSWSIRRKNSKSKRAWQFLAELLASSISCQWWLRTFFPSIWINRCASSYFLSSPRENVFNALLNISHCSRSRCRGLVALLIDSNRNWVNLSKCNSATC